MVVVEVKPIGVFHMADEKGPDEKIICVPVSDPIWNQKNDLKDINPHRIKEIEHFFQVYKDLEKKKVDVGGWGNAQEAIKIYHECEKVAFFILFDFSTLAPVKKITNKRTKMEYIIKFLPGFGILALLYVVWKNAWVGKQDVGNDKMARIAKNIADGAMSFLKAEYKILSIFVLAL